MHTTSIMSEHKVTSASSSPASFPQFARFPPELRIKIWEMAIDEPRTIPLLCVPESHIQRSLMIDGVPFIDVPTFLFVNRECRDIAVEKYTKMTAQFKARTNAPNVCFPLLELNLLLKDGDKFEFHGMLPCYIVFRQEGDEYFTAQWDSPLRPYDAPQANRWLKSLLSGCNTGEVKAFPDVEMSCTIAIQQPKPPYFAFGNSTPNKPVWTIDLAQTPEEIIDKFLKRQREKLQWERENLLPHLFAWTREPSLVDHL
ncbi:hypothetical protein GGR51DRAFT_523205, partial [Nemania sp. FL0031]